MSENWVVCIGVLDNLAQGIDGALKIVKCETVSAEAFFSPPPFIQDPNIYGAKC